jgi:hypothetical protein
MFLKHNIQPVPGTVEHIWILGTTNLARIIQVFHSHLRKDIMFLKHNMQPVPGTNHTSEVDLCFIPLNQFIPNTEHPTGFSVGFIYLAPFHEKLPTILHGNL